MFGEMLGVWLVAEWMGQNRPESGVQLIELGPGRGTLMSDILHTLRSFAALNKAIESIYLIEASPALRETQRSLLCGEGVELEELPDETGYTAVSKYSDIPITWLNEFKSVPKSALATPFIIAHEFFDALPVHAFEATKHGWRELMVTMGTTHSGLGTPKSRITGVPVPEFSLTRAPAATAHALLLPELSQRYKALKAKEGAIVEISPESMALVEDIAGRIGAVGRGAALIIDYGPLDTIPVNSLRGIRQHRTVSPFSSPGEVDISADVDFYGLAERALVASDNVEVHGPVEQGTFLLVMGMRERMQRLTKGMTEDEKKSKVEAGFNRLVERGGGAMGKVYKAMAIIPERGGRRPVGFGGGVK
jgi:NADH dehydrogenase [ubiquinone] 1 alpha subcomplex assembly factor 7